MVVARHACSGFARPPSKILFGGLDDFVDLQQRGLFRREYERKTSRENLGLPPPREPLLQQARG